MRIIIGIVLLVAAGMLIFLMRTRPQVTQTNVVQKIDLSGDISMEQMTCNACGAPFSKDSLDVRDGAVFVDCEHCGATYQFEEEIKW